MAENAVVAETTGYVVSLDGSRIGYRKFGSGPALVILHGALLTSQYYVDLAKSLANSFTVYLADRRGRGLSVTKIPDYGIEKEKEDLKALIEEHGAEYVFGHSAGAVIALEASFELPIKKMALYEPIVLVNGILPFPVDWLSAFNQAVAEKHNYKAMALFISNLKMTSLSKLPHWLFSLVLRVILHGKNKRDAIAILPTLGREIEMLKTLDPDVERYKTNRTGTLLLTGERSPAYFRNAIRVLLKNMPLVSLTILPDHDHTSLTVSNILELSAEIKRFLLEPMVEVGLLV